MRPNLTFPWPRSAAILVKTATRHSLSSRWLVMSLVIWTLVPMVRQAVIWQATRYRVILRQLIQIKIRNWTKSSSATKKIKLAKTSVSHTLPHKKMPKSKSDSRRTTSWIRDTLLMRHTRDSSPRKVHWASRIQYSFHVQTANLHSIETSTRPIFNRRDNCLLTTPLRRISHHCSLIRSK